ncbi:MAG TPA: pyridoxamine 5'-phosphate oxidase [Thermoleophilaceae bacterium]|jgi:pyridoxamine 5'-phosphate oxidase|nr:pyridoxamine 5'-phosphate oxidase [Thermoleophilaceae bacterium]
MTDPDPDIRNRPLHEGELDSDPLAQFGAWFEDAGAQGAHEPEAVALATASPDGAPSVRMVLMKRYGPEGLTFFTNYGSRKGEELGRNPRAALLFYWPELGRQVRVEGSVERVPRELSEEYARSRSRGSQLSALASPQSRPLQDRDWLEQRVAQLEREYSGVDELPVGDSWGGFRLTPDAWEFWQQRRDRLHDRFRFEPAAGGGWSHQRLGP